MAIFSHDYFLLLLLASHVSDNVASVCVLTLFSSNTYTSEEVGLLHPSEVGHNFVILTHW